MSPRRLPAATAQRSDPGTPRWRRTSPRYTEREKAALGYTDAIVWNADFADDALWDDLHSHFTPAELAELGFFIALTSGQQRWLKTLDLGHREILADTDAGLATEGVGTG
jgi:alkylhydroperoxidase family enzyme